LTVAISPVGDQVLLAYRFGDVKIRQLWTGQVSPDVKRVAYTEEVLGRALERR
jgi:hypothetical protein